MVLSSQMARPGTTRSNMYARGGARRNRLIAISGGAVVLVLSAWWFWPQSSSGAEGQPGGPNASGTEQASLNPVPSHGTDKPASPEDARLASRQPAQRQQPPQREPQHNEANLLPPGIGAGDQSNEPIESPADDVKTTPEYTGAPPLTMGQTPGGAAGESNQPFKRETSPAAESMPDQPASNQPASKASPSGDVNAEVAALLQRADREINASQLVQGRATLNQALEHPKAGVAAEQIRTRLAELNATMVFGKTVVKGDPFAQTHTIKSGDRLSLIARSHAVDTAFLAQINGMSNPDQIRVGQNVKVINGPFHVEIDKSEYRLDLFLGEPGSSDRTYVRSFFIGLGELGSTPTGHFRVRSNGKVKNPGWTNPRTGEHFKAGDPKNPIGKYWIGLEGADEQTKLLDGYGIHGTIDPSSIGRQMSMGCVRLYDADIEMLFGMLAAEKSTVWIHE